MFCLFETAVRQRFASRERRRGCGLVQSAGPGYPSRKFRLPGKFTCFLHSRTLELESSRTRERLANCKRTKARTTMGSKTAALEIGVNCGFGIISERHTPQSSGEQA